jgi:hypothetical protein
MHKTWNFHINYLKNKQIKFVYQKKAYKIKKKNEVSQKIPSLSGTCLSRSGLTVKRVTVPMRAVVEYSWNGTADAFQQ